MKLTKSLLIAALACGTLWAQAPADHSAKTPAKTPPPAIKSAPAKAPATAAKATPAPAPVKGATPAKTPMTAAKAPTAAAKPAAPVTATKGVPVKAVTPAKTIGKPVASATPKAPIAVKSQAMPAKAPVAQQKTHVGKAPIVKMPVPVTASKGMKAEGKAKPASAKEQTTATRVGKQRDPFISPVVRSAGTIGSGCDTGKKCLVVDQIVLKGIVKSPAGFIAVVENPAKRAYFMRENDPVFNGRITKITGDTVVFQEQVMDKVGKQTMREVVKKVNAPVV